jgi:hypothetical protein
VHAFIADRDTDDVPALSGVVTYASADEPSDWVDVAGDSCAAYAALPDARSGECVTGESCGCGAADNAAWVGPLSYGITADQACCACKGSCGGLYGVTYTPTIAGVYTLAVMHGYQLEVQNISSSWTTITGRAGYFQLSSGVCTLLAPCEKTKPLAWDASAADVKQAIESLGLDGGVTVAHTLTSDLKNLAWLVTFHSACDVRELNLHTTMPMSIATGKTYDR